MREKETSKRKDWIKNVAIIFLVILLLLTFFSNTIMNYSLPEVATQYVMSGSITAKIRGNGMVEAGDPYNVEMKETRVIASVPFRNGDTVQKGDVLYYLEDQESAELEAAQKELDRLVKEYETALLSSEVTSEIYQHVQSGNNTTVSQYRAKLDDANAKVDAAQNTVDSIQAVITSLQSQITILEATAVDTSAEKKAVNDATANVSAWETEYAARESEYANAKNAYESLGYTLAEAQSEYDTAYAAWEADQSNQTLIDNLAAAESKRNTAQNNYNWMNNANTNRSAAADSLKTARNTLTQAEKALADKEANIANVQKLNSLKLQLATEQTKMDAANKVLEDAKMKRDKLYASIQTELNLSSQYDAIQAQKKVVSDLKSKSIGAYVECPISGRLSSVNYIAGQTAAAGDVIAVIQPEGKGYTLSFSVTTEQAKRISVGDIADVSNSWYYGDIRAVVTAIKPDPSNPSSSKLVECEITGSDVTPGQSLNLSIGQKSSNYDLVVPNSAIREDSNGKYILIVESKSSPLGNRYFATRVDVEILASDDTQTAISAALYGYEYVITTSTKPVKEGKQVRLAD